MTEIVYTPHYWDGEEYQVVCNSYINELPLHRHEYNELFLVLDGTLSQCKNGKREKIEKKGLCFMYPDDSHSFVPEKNNERIVIVNCEFSDGILSEIEAFLSDSGLMVPKEGWSRTLRHLPDDIWRELTSKARRLAFHGASNSSSKEIRRVLFKSFLIDVLSLIAAPEVAMVTNPPRWLSRLRETMQDEDNFIAGLPRMIELSGYSQEYLIRMMRRYYHDTPTEFINRLRIKKAVAMLSENRYDTGRIMVECGFNHYSWFLRCFKRYFGMSPSQYLRISRSGNRKK